MKPKLVKPSDRELDEAVAEYVAGWRRVHGEWRSPQKSDAIERTGICTDELEHPPFYSTRADAVLPLLEKMVWFYVETQNSSVWLVHVSTGNLSEDHYKARADTFPRAICLALLRAHGVEVET